MRVHILFVFRAVTEIALQNLTDISVNGAVGFLCQRAELQIQFLLHQNADSFLWPSYHIYHLKTSLRDIPLKVNKGISLNA